VIVDRTTGQFSESEVLDLAARLAWNRPLAPYPYWRFDVDWDVPELPLQLRRQVWTHFRERKQQAPLVVEWYDGLHVQLYLSNDASKQLYVAGCIEPNEFVFLDGVLSPGQVFVDAGANDGLFSLFAARRVGPTGQVWAFEPSRRELERLQRNAGLNHLGNVRTFPVALSDENGSALLRVAEDEHAGQNTLGQFAYDTGLLRQDRVALQRLDDLAGAEGLSRLDVMKIDVEGAELAVLRGAEKLIRKFHPVLLVEANDAALRHQGSSSQVLADYLRSCGYTVYAFRPATGKLAKAERGEFSDNLVAAPAKMRLAA
jgi:FkbM family methyltransferase